MVFILLRTSLICSIFFYHTLQLYPGQELMLEVEPPSE
jgi:hypothetical protein